MRADAVRADYENKASKLDPNDSEGRRALKDATRSKTLGEKRRMMRSLNNMVRFFKGIGVMRQSIKPAADGFILRDPDGSKSIRLSEVVTIDGAKVDKVTYEENFLVLTMVAARTIAIGELADGFSEFVAAITTFLTNFPENWSVNVDRAQPGHEIRVWAKG